jgi:hypothetical protein
VSTYTIRAGERVIGQATNLADAEKILRQAVRDWRNAMLLPSQKAARSSYTAVRWDRGTRRAANERPDTGALRFMWELRDRKYGFHGYARVDLVVV